MPYNGIGGGHVVIYEWANRLSLKGFDVIIYIPFFIPVLQYNVKSLGYISKGIIRSILRKSKVKWFPLHAPIKIIPYISNKYIRDADIVILESLNTIKPVLHLSPTKGKKVLFLHSKWLEETVQKVKYLLENDSFIKFSVSYHLYSYLKSFIPNLKIHAIIPNGVDIEVFKPKRIDRIFDILIYYQPDFRKGGDLAIKVARELIEKYPHITVNFLSTKRYPINNINIRHYWFGLNRDDVAHVYNMHKIFVYPSRYEAFGLPPLEAMACGLAVVATDTGAVREYGKNLHSCLISQPEPEKITKCVELLLKNDTLANNLRENARKEASLWNWEYIISNNLVPHLVDVAT